MRNCTICEHLGSDDTDDTNLCREKVWCNKKQRNITLVLCRSHSVELFKNGMDYIGMKYAPEILTNVVNTNDMDFIDLLHDAFHNNLHKVY